MEDLDQQIKTLEQNKKGKITLVIIEIVLVLITPIILSIMNNNRDGCVDPGLSEEQVANYNSRFLSYEGVQNGATVRALCDVIRANNLQNEDDVSKQIVLTEATATDPADADTAGTDSAGIITIKSKINVGRRYIVSFGYTSSGLIKNIGIEPKNE